MEHFFNIGVDAASVVPLIIIVVLFLAVLSSIVALLFMGGAR